MNKLVRNFIDECKRTQYFKKKYKENYIEFKDYFKRSDKDENSKIVTRKYLKSLENSF